MKVKVSEKEFFEFITLPQLCLERLLAASHTYVFKDTIGETIQDLFNLFAQNDGFALLGSIPV